MGEDRLLEMDLALEEQPAVRVVGGPQTIDPRADEEILVAFPARAIDDEIRPALDLACRPALHLDVAQDPASPRGRLFGPGMAGLQTLHAHLQAGQRIV